ncbi:MAG: RND family transporter [Candidatus Thermoplasmatota archaeon]|nr:RND family transporter [Candidatus Thermoplasmatota archaeon]
MKALEAYGKTINKAPWIFIAGILIITLIMGYFSMDFQMGSDEGSFAPDNEISRADQRVREEYGSQSGQLIVLFRSDGNVLSPGSLNAMLDLEEAIQGSDITDIVIKTLDTPDGVTSPADIIIRSIYYNISLQAVATYAVTRDGPMSDLSSCPDAGNLTNTLTSKGSSLSMEEKRVVLNGGVVLIDVDCLAEPLQLEFKGYDPSQLSGYTSDAPMARGLEFLLSREYVNGSSAAGSALFILTTEPDLDPDIALRMEEELQSMADVIEKDQEGLRILVIGDEIVNKAINEASGSSMMVLGTLALVAIILVLVLVFRSAFEIILNVVALFMAILWVFGVGGIMGFEGNPALTTVPVLVIGLGVDYGIHMTIRYREELRSGKNVLEASTAAEASVGFAILLATVTTLIGFLSNVTAGSEGIRVFGILNATGILAAFVIMITFVPAVRVLRDRRRERKGIPLLSERKLRKENMWGWAGKRAADLGLKEDEAFVPSGIGGINRVLSYGTSLAVRPVPVILAVIVLTGIGLAGAARLEPTFDFRDFLPDGVEVSEASKSLVTDFDFSSEEACVIVEGDVSDPAVFKAMDEVKDNAMEGSTIVSSGPIDSPVEIARGLSDPASPAYDTDFYVLWHSNVDRDFDGIIDEDIDRQNVTTVYDAIFLIEPEQTSRVLKKDQGGNYMGLVIRVPVNSRAGELADEVWEDMVHAARPMEELEGGQLDRVTATGGPLLQKVILDDISSSQARSVIFTFLISLGILTAVFLVTKRSLFMGLITLLPLVMVIAWTLGGMYYFGIPLNVVTVTISAITVGLGIDYGIHISQRFMEDRDRIPDGICALTATLSHTGSALFGSAMTTVIGFAILSFAIIPPLAQFGQVTALSVSFAFLASVFVLPTFLLLWLKGNHWYRRKIRGETIPSLEKDCRMDP